MITEQHGFSAKSCIVLSILRRPIAPSSVSMKVRLFPSSFCIQNTKCLSTWFHCSTQSSFLRRFLEVCTTICPSPFPTKYGSLLTLDWGLHPVRCSRINKLPSNGSLKWSKVVCLLVEISDSWNLTHRFSIAAEHKYFHGIKSWPGFFVQNNFRLESWVSCSCLGLFHNTKWLSCLRDFSSRLQSTPAQGNYDFLWHDPTDRNLMRFPPRHKFPSSRYKHHFVLSGLISGTSTSFTLYE